MSNREIFQKLYYSQKSGTIDIFLYHLGEQFRDIDFKGKVVLEIGCGNGLVSLWLALCTNTGNVTAIDEYEGFGEDKNNYKFFKKVIEENSLHIELQKTDFGENNFEPDSFDMVVANGCISFLLISAKNSKVSHLILDRPT